MISSVSGAKLGSQCRHLLLTGARDFFHDPITVLRLPPVREIEVGNPREVHRVAGHENPAVFQRGCGDDEVGVAVGTAALAGEYREVCRTVEDCVRERQDERVLAERGQLGQEPGCALLLVALLDLESSADGERELPVVSSTRIVATGWRLFQGTAQSRLCSMMAINSRCRFGPSTTRQRS